MANIPTKYRQKRGMAAFVKICAFQFFVHNGHKNGKKFCTMDRKTAKSSSDKKRFMVKCFLSSR